MLYGERQRIWDQAENRRHAQKALLELLCGLASGAASSGTSRAPSPRALRLATLTNDHGPADQRHHPPAPRRRTRRSPSTRSPSAAPESPASTATSSSSRAAIPGDTVRVEVGKSKRAYAEARVLEVVTPSPDRIEPVAAPSRGAVAGDPLRQAARDQGRAGRRRAAADRQARRLQLRADHPGACRSGATATSSSTRSARTQTAD